MRTPRLACAATLGLLMIAAGARAQPGDTKKPSIPEAVSKGAEVVLSLEEKDRPGEWPYEGVYRVDGQIPIGYRIGGTGICSMALMSAPGV